MPKSIIAVDIDDVIAGSTEALRLIVNERTGSNLTKEDYRIEADYWGYYERVWANHNLVDKIKLEDLSAEMAIDQSHIPLLSGAEFAISKLIETHQVVLITARDRDKEKATRNWLKQLLLLEEIELYFTESHKDPKSQTKGQICKELGAGWLIDDNVQHCESALKEGVEAILFGEYGWHYKSPKELIRCRDWPAVLEYFDGR